MNSEELENIVNDNSPAEDFTAVSNVMNILSSLSEASRARVMETVSTFFNFSSSSTPTQKTPIRSQQLGQSQSTVGHFSEERELSIKEFLLEKMPQTDVERVACLAYYLSNYRDTPHFKTIDISKLNTEGAQRKFSNPAKAVDNAAIRGYLVQAPKKGYKQLSAGGEVYIQALPDRAEAKESLAQHTRPRIKKASKRKKA